MVRFRYRPAECRHGSNDRELPTAICQASLLIYLLIHTLMIFHSILGFRLGSIDSVADDFRGFRFRFFVYDRAFCRIRIQNNKIFSP
jgi:hypothetical protein